jgi:hypothetical protein
MDTQIILIAYLIYIPIALSLTYYVAHTLFRNARVFMLDIFNQKEDIALSTNRLFEVGFYLLNLGFALMILKIESPMYNPIDSYQELVEVLSRKIGGFSIYLGIMLFGNLYMFFRGRRASKMHRAMQATIQ